MRILLTGATGFLGSAICSELQKQGYMVFALSRHPEGVSMLLGKDVVAVSWSELDAALSEVDGVINLAGASIAGRRWNQEYKQLIRSSRVETTGRLVEAIAHSKKPPRTLVSASAVGYYGDCGEKMVTEKSPAGVGFLAEVCQQWEEAACQARSYGCRVVLVRLGTVLGPGGALERMLHPVPFLPINPWKLGIGGPFGAGNQWMPWIHRDDAVGLFLFALAEERLDGSCNAVAPEAVSNKEFARALAGVYGRGAPVALPAFLLRLMLGEFAETLLTGQRVVPEVPAKLGYSFRYATLDPALRAAIAELERKKHGAR